MRNNSSLFDMSKELEGKRVLVTSVTKGCRASN